MSNNFKIFETDQFINNLDKIKGKTRKKIYKKITDYIYPQLKENPYYGKNIKKLINWSPETWRYRLGDFRIFYEIDKVERIVFICNSQDLI